MSYVQFVEFNDNDKLVQIQNFGKWAAVKQQMYVGWG